MKWGVILSSLAACSFPTPSEQYACSTTADCDSGRICEGGFCVVGTPIDAEVIIPTIDAPPTCAQWTPKPRHFDPCMITAPTGPLMLTTAGTYTYNTSDGTLTDPASVVTTPASTVVATGRVLSVESFSLSAGTTLRVVGNQPVIIASWSTLSVAGTINVSSLAGNLGAGANSTACATHAPMPGVSNVNGGGGGGGAGFSAVGGVGGTGDGGGGGQGGTAIAAPLLRGGCAGANGGNGENNGGGGAGGPGGGAVQLTARMGVDVEATARISANGAGGGIALVNQGAQGGGAGGGSGGMIGIEGASVTIASAAILAANGGSGSEGSGNQQGNAGQPGALAATRAPGGAGGSDAGDGGPGGALPNPVGGPGLPDNEYGGGGGGGSAGFIVLAAPTTPTTAGAVISPAPTVITITP